MKASVGLKSEELYYFMTPVPNAITYMQAGVRFTLASLLLSTGESCIRVWNVKGIHSCPHLVDFQLFLYDWAGGPYAWAVSASTINITHVHVRPLAALFTLCALFTKQGINEEGALKENVSLNLEKIRR